MKLRAALIALPAALLLAACGGSTDTDDASAETTTTAAAAPAISCSEFGSVGENAEVIETVRTMPEIAGHTVTSVRISKDSDYPDQWALAVTLCDPSIENVDALRPVATSFAKAVKAQPWAGEVFALYVGNDWLVDGELAPEQKLKDGDFQMHLWNGKPSEAAENKNWEFIAG
ncbi:hypothetical protein [Rhodococcus pyridinivorans]|uniref:Lipoprotein n=1 Tax=Rhodococcus pyridinivorans AK37 TaxID=1114960 RepID=H0JL30_9NOCA|nr:hypothetical protein [Rhodococcus pyridinivorans]EHK86365.1 hypothetical protein AK37_01417 [Rhodococcus pyridinivorans AK37]MCD2139546.1 hypothetical protein [Rhodococcus pyridinivorans]